MQSDDCPPWNDRVESALGPRAAQWRANGSWLIDGLADGASRICPKLPGGKTRQAVRVQPTNAGYYEIVRARSTGLSTHCIYLWNQPAPHRNFAGPRQIPIDHSLRALRLRKYPAEEVEGLFQQLQSLHRSSLTAALSSEQLRPSKQYPGNLATVVLRI